MQARQTKNRLLALRNISLNAVFLPGIVLLLLTVLVVRGISSWSGWWGTAFFFGGLLILPVPFVQRWLVPGMVINAVDDVPPAFLDEVTQAALVTNREIFFPLYWQAGLLVLIGFVLLVLSVVTRTRSAPGAVDDRTRPTGQ